MSFWKRFDMKVVLYFTGNINTRIPGMERELKRVGLEDAYRQWQFPSPMDKVLLSGMRHVKLVERRGYFNCTMGHYRAIATAYHVGAKSVLVMEDDIRFLRDVESVGAIVDSIPEDYDLAMLDPTYVSSRPKWLNNFIMSGWRIGRKVNGLWAEFDELRSCGCYALSRRGMERMLSLYESATPGGNGKMMICDMFLDRRLMGEDARMYFALRNAAIQVPMANSNSSVAEIYGKYASMGIIHSDYADA